LGDIWTLIIYSTQCFTITMLPVPASLEQGHVFKCSPSQCVHDIVQDTSLRLAPLACIMLPTILK